MDLLLNTDENTLWKFFKANDKRAYALIYKLFAEELYSYGLHFTSDTNKVEDAIHDLFVILYEKRDHLPNVDSVKAYLFTCLRNQLFKLKKKEKLEFQLESVQPEQLTQLQTTDSEDELIENEDQKYRTLLVEKLEEALSPREKEAIYYRYIHQLSIEHISNMMDINKQSTKNLLYSSIQKMRKYSLTPILIYLPTLFL